MTLLAAPPPLTVRAPVRTARPLLASGLVLLALGLVANAVLGPLLLDVADDGFPRTVRNQAIGLEVVTLVLVVPWALLAARAARRGRAAAPVLAVAPAGYAAYMLLQYVVGHAGPVPRIALLQVPLLALSVAVLAEAVRGFGDGPVASLSLLGWFVLVPVSVAAMSVAMLARDDPHASAAGTAFLVVAAVAFSAYGAAQLRPLVHEFSVTNSLVNPVLAPVLRSPAGRLLGGLAVLTYTGRQTGRLHQLVCQVRADRRELLVVVERPQEKRWWRNFRTPAPVDVWVRGHRHAGTAQAELLDSTTVVRIRLDAPVRRA
jgi:hypothetical protein